VKESLPRVQTIVFNGDGYSEAWHAEAAKRGLPNLKTTPDALPALKDQGVSTISSRSTKC
jgi:glutamine synthetase